MIFKIIIIIIIDETERELYKREIKNKEGENLIEKARRNNVNDKDRN